MTSNACGCVSDFVCACPQTLAMPNPVVAFVGSSKRAQAMVAHYYEHVRKIQIVRAIDFNWAAQIHGGSVTFAGRADYLLNTVADACQHDALVVCDLSSNSDVAAVKQAAQHAQFVTLVDPLWICATDPLEFFDEQICRDTFIDVADDSYFPVTVTNESAIADILGKIAF
jgi:hypothetical protein